MSNLFYLTTEVNEEKLKPVNVIPKSIQITGKIYSKNLMTIDWVSLPDNLPATNGNILSVWQNTGLPWGQGTNPIQKTQIQTDSQYGDQIFEFPIERKPYIVAYGTSDTGSAWAATLQFNPGSAEGIPVISTIELVQGSLGNNSLITQFSTPPGNNPNANKNWIGLWKGTKVTYDGSNRIAKVDIESSFAQDMQKMNGLELTINTTYTLGYACGPKDSDLSAFVTFTTAAY